MSAIRYSGDTEIRVMWLPRQRRYKGSVRDPNVSWHGECDKLGYADPRSSDAYDDAARKLAEAANSDFKGKLQVEWKHGRIRIRRVFQAPCPVE